MSRWSLRRRTPADTPDLTKAAAPAGPPVAPAATYTAAQVAALLAANSSAPQTTGVFNPLPRTDPQVAFGPGLPLFPAALDPPRPDSGRPEPRSTEYPVSWNLPGISDRLVPWKVLRDAAGIGGLPRRCIEIRKNEVASLDWAITITKQAVAHAQAQNPGAPRADVEAQLRDELGSEIARCTAFWVEPDPRQGEDTGEWLSKLLEEHLVLDALAIYPRYTYGGDLAGLEIIDGSTVKCLRDHTGGRPQPPNPAYQQILWGFPRGEYIADATSDGDIPGGYPSDRLIYKRRNVRTWTPYGYSAMEQALEDIDVWLRRRMWIKTEYTDGAVPSGVVRNTGVSGWTPGQVLEYERNLNDTWSGSTIERHRLRVLPPGFELENLGNIAEKYKPEYDLYLIKTVASHFDTTIAELGFTEANGLGSSGYHEGQADVQDRKATLPTKRWLQALLTWISRRHLAMPLELEFRILGLEDEDEAAADQVAQNRVQYGRMTLNEDRDRTGSPRYSFAEADMPMLMTPRGVVFLEGASQTAPPGVFIEPPHSDGTAGDGSGDTEGAQSEGSDGSDDAPSKIEHAEAAKAELAAYHRWARRNHNPSRPFMCKVLTKADAPDLAVDPRLILAKARVGGDSPKAASRHWPGWDRDLATAAVWAGRLSTAMAGSIDTTSVAERWLAETLVQDDDDERWSLTAALAFLHRHNVTVISGLALVRLVWIEGYAIGDTAARTLLAGEPEVVWEWAQGDADGAHATLDTRARQELDAWLHHTATTAQEIEGSRLAALARALVAGGKTGEDARSLASRLSGVLSDPGWAHLVAITELSRASNRAAKTAYRDAGIQVNYWITDADTHVCQICLDNEDYGAVPVGGTWPDGSQEPPAHPNCRCHLYPDLANRQDADAAQLDDGT